MKSFQKGLLLGIGMVVACGTFVASTSSEKDTYTIVEEKERKVSFLTYEKAKDGEHKNMTYNLISKEIFKLWNARLYKFEETEAEHKDGKVIGIDRKVYVGENCIWIEKNYFDKSKDTTYYVNSKGEKISFLDCENYEWIDSYDLNSVY